MHHISAIFKNDLYVFVSAQISIARLHMHENCITKLGVTLAPIVQ